MRRIIVNPLTPRPVHVSMRLKDHRAPATSARLARGVHITPCRGARPAHHNLVLAPRRRLTSIVPAALALAVEQVVVRAVLVHERALLVRLDRIVRDVVRAAATARHGLRRARHRYLVDVPPEAAEGEQIGAPVLDQVRVDRVVGLSGGGADAGGPEVGPGADVEAGGGRDADGGVLRAEGAHGVVQVVG